MWLRVLLAGVSLALIGLFVWLAAHDSQQAAVLGRYSYGYAAGLLGLAGLLVLSLLAQAPALYRRLHVVRFEILLMILATAGSLGLAEIVVRLVDPITISFFDENARFDRAKIPDPALYYRMGPGLQETYQGVPLLTNSLGMRERELAPKAAGELRVMLLGDSVTMGWGVPVEVTFGRRLEGLLSARLDRPVRTVNTAVNSYNTVAQYGVLRTYADAVQPDLVILTYVNNDYALNKPVFTPPPSFSWTAGSPPQTLRALVEKSRLYQLGGFFLKYGKAADAARLDVASPGVVASMTALGGMADWCRQRGIPFVTFFYRSKDEPMVALSDALLAEVQAVAAARQFPLLDIGPWWSGVDRRDVTVSPADPHPNARGHEIMAEGMVDFLLAQRVVTP